MRLRSANQPDRYARVLDTSRMPAALRLMEAERTDEIYPILLEEVLRMGFPRALVVSVDFETGEVGPAAAVKCTDSYLERFRTSLFAADNPLISVMHSLQPE